MTRKIANNGLGGAVYMLICAGDVIYVGKSLSLRSRLRHHAATKVFDHALFCFSEEPLFSMDDLESHLIDLHRPMLNRSVPKIHHGNEAPKRLHLRMVEKDKIKKTKPKSMSAADSSTHRLHKKSSFQIQKLIQHKTLSGQDVLLTPDGLLHCRRSTSPRRLIIGTCACNKKSAVTRFRGRHDPNEPSPNMAAVAAADEITWLEPCAAVFLANAACACSDPTDTMRMLRGRPLSNVDLMVLQYYSHP